MTARSIRIFMMNIMFLGFFKHVHFVCTGSFGSSDSMGSIFYFGIILLQCCAFIFQCIQFKIDISNHFKMIFPHAFVLFKLINSCNCLYNYFVLNNEIWKLNDMKQFCFIFLYNDMNFSEFFLMKFIFLIEIRL